MNVVADFEPELYYGTWHQIAAIPAWFQEQCAANTTAEYSALEKGLLLVVNSCDRADGARDSAEARARFQGSKEEAKLDVTFVKLWGRWLWAAGGDYWIIGLDPEYRWSVVGEPSRKFAWVLAREPQLSASDLQKVEEILTHQGYDACGLILTTPGDKGTLCRGSKS